MSPRKVVKNLHDLSADKFENLLVQTLSEDFVETDSIAIYLQFASYDILTRLLRDILRTLDVDAGTRYACLRVLLRNDVTRLVTGMFPAFYYSDILHSIRIKAGNLTELNLKGVWVRDFPQLLARVVRNLTKLRVLIVPHMADDDVIQEAMQSCPLLEVLDISGEATFTQRAFNMLNSKVLRVLSIGSFGKIKICSENDLESFGKVIKQLPSLVAVTTYSYTGSALGTLLEPLQPTKLTHLHDINTTLNTMKKILVTCPNLSSIHLDSPSEPSVTSQLSNLTHLTSLKLTKFDEELTKLLQTPLGGRLRNLTLQHNKTTSVDLSTLAVTCSNLETLNCFHTKLLFMDSSNYFMNLQTIELIHVEITVLTMRNLLTNCPFLKQFYYAGLTHLSDGDVTFVVDFGQLYNLKKFWVAQAPLLTGYSVKLLMDSCENLVEIGDLTGWSVNIDELDLLRAIITSGNLDVRLLPVI